LRLQQKFENELEFRSHGVLKDIIQVFLRMIISESIFFKSKDRSGNMTN